MNVKPHQRDDLNMLEPERVEQKTQEALKAAVPSSPLFREVLGLLFLPLLS